MYLKKISTYLSNEDIFEFESQLKKIHLSLLVHSVWMQKILFQVIFIIQRQYNTLNIIYTFWSRSIQVGSIGGQYKCGTRGYQFNRQDQNCIANLLVLFSLSLRTKKLMVDRILVLFTLLNIKIIPSLVFRLANPFV